MKPGALPLSLYRGDSYRWRFTLWVDAGKTQPADLTGVAVKAEIRERPAGPLITELVCAIEEPNVIAAELRADDSTKLPANGGAWDLELTYPAGDVVTILAGPVDVTMDVTNSAPVAAGAARSQFPRRIAG